MKILENFVDGDSVDTKILLTLLSSDIIPVSWQNDMKLIAEIVLTHFMLFGLFIYPLNLSENL